EGEVHVADIERGTVLGGDAEGRAIDGILDPDAVLGDDGGPPDGNRQVYMVGPAGQPLSHRAEVAFEEKSVEVEVEIVDELVFDPAADQVARKRVVFVDRAREGMNTLGGGEL